MEAFLTEERFLFTPSCGENHCDPDLEPIRLADKLSRLQNQLGSCDRVMVAYSGGVDSSLLLRVACDCLGPERVTALHGVSCLIPVPEQKKAQRLVTAPDGIGCSYLAVKLTPLRWPEFAANSERRCYFCKKKMYQALQAALPGDELFLFDGTNSDDLLTDRPGLAAIRELSVQTPLAAARLNKKDIRSLARQMGLSNWNQPANSCLATRIPTHQKITGILLKQIRRAEQFLCTKGFPGCRVKAGKNLTVIEVPVSDVELFISKFRTDELTGKLADLGLAAAPLTIRSRACC